MFFRLSIRSNDVIRSVHTNVIIYPLYCSRFHSTSNVVIRSVHPNVIVLPRYPVRFYIRSNDVILYRMFIQTTCLYYNADGEVFLYAAPLVVSMFVSPLQASVSRQHVQL